MEHLQDFAPYILGKSMVSDFPKKTNLSHVFSNPFPFMYFHYIPIIFPLSLAFPLNRWEYHGHWTRVYFIISHISQHIWIDVAFPLNQLTISIGEKNPSHHLPPGGAGETEATPNRRRERSPVHRRRSGREERSGGRGKARWSACRGLC